MPSQIALVKRLLCDTLSVLHEQDIIHRDVKPSNIILCNYGHIKLIDFDAARIKKTTTDKDTRFIGTDDFMQTDERSDIYAFGVTIKLLLGENYAKSPYKCVIEKCTRFNPDERYSSMKAVHRALILIPFKNIDQICGETVPSAKDALCAARKTIVTTAYCMYAKEI